MSQVDNSSKEIEKRTEQILEWKSTVIKINLLEKLNIRFELVEEKISKPERKKSVEIIQSEEQQSPQIHELTELKVEVDHSDTIVGDFNTPLSIVDKPTRQ